MAIHRSSLRTVALALAVLTALSTTVGLAPSGLAEQASVEETETVDSKEGWSLTVEANVTPAVEKAPPAVSVDHDAHVAFEGLIPIGFPTEDDAEDCAYQGSCPELEGVAFTDVKLSDPPPDQFEVYNGLTSSATKWLACSYENGSLANCHYDRYFAGGLVGDLESGVDTLRLMPYHASYNNYHLDFSG